MMNASQEQLSPPDGNYTRVIVAALAVLIFVLPLTVDPGEVAAYSLPRLVLMQVVLIGIGLMWVARALQLERFVIQRSPADLPLVLLAAVSALSTVASVNVKTALFGEYAVYEGFTTIAGYLLLAFISLNFVTTRRSANLLVAGLLSSAGIVSALAIAGHYGFDLEPLTTVFREGDFIRPAATLGNPVLLGSYLALVLPIALVLSADRTYERSVRLIAMAAAVLATPAIVLTASRAAWLGLGVALAFIASVAISRRLRERTAALAMVAVVLAMLLLGVMGGAAYLRERALSMFSPGAGSSADRMRIWHTTSFVIADYPGLGTGPDTLGLVFNRYRSAAYARSEEELATTTKAHNEPLQVASTMGAAGLVAFLWLVLLGFSTGFRGIAGSEYLRRKTLLFALLSGLVGYAVQLQFGFSHVAVAPLSWIVLGTVLSLSDTGRSPRDTHVVRLPKRLCARRGAVVLALLAASAWLVFALLQPVVADRHFASALEYERRGLVDPAILEHVAAGAVNPGEETYWYSLGNAYFRRAELSRSLDGFRFNLGNARRAYSRAQAANPLDEASHFYAGRAYQIAGQRLGDESLFRLAVRNDRVVLSLNPNFATAHLNLGASLASLGLLDAAIREWSKAKWLNPNDADAYYNLGWVYEKKGLTRRAVGEYGAALRVDSELQAAREALERLSSD